MAKYYLEDIPPVYNINEVQPKEKILDKLKG